jgi:hypothetical protein
VSYRYESSKAEQRAAALLRDKGWRVSEPPCPDCMGSGSISRWNIEPESVATVTHVSGDYTTGPCPRGCVVMTYSPTGTWAA